MPRIIQSGQGNFNSQNYLESTDFPNTTNLYGWRASESNATFDTVYGGINLTLNGSIGQTTDHLGNTRYCNFDGSTTFLNSSDSAFSFTGTFSMCFWAYKSSWSGATNYLVSRHNGSNGWSFYSYGFNFDIGTTNVIPNINASTRFPDGWHHFAIVRESSRTSLYIDGMLVSKTGYNNGSLTASGNLEIGSYNGGSSKLLGKLNDIWIHNGTTWTSDQVRAMYARGSRRISSLDNNGIVDVELPLKSMLWTWNPIWYKSDGTTTWSPNGYDYHSYRIVDGICHIGFGVVNSSVTLGNSSNSIYFTPPLLFQGNYNTSHDAGQYPFMNVMQEGVGNYSRWLYPFPNDNLGTRWGVSFFSFSTSSPYYVPSYFTNSSSRTDFWYTWTYQAMV